MILHPDSHVDHVNPLVVGFVRARFADRDAFFVETIELPADLPDVECNLFGPTLGDLAVVEDVVSYQRRGKRAYASRVVDRKPRQTRTLTVVAGPHKEEPCVLFTVYGGPPAPREPDDGTLSMGSAEMAKSVEFWATHALARSADAADLTPNSFEMIDRRNRIGAQTGDRRFMKPGGAA